MEIKLNQRSDEMRASSRHVLVTGANGFIGKNLLVRLKELPNITVSTFVRDDDVAILSELIKRADSVIHLAGENRPQDDNAFERINAGLTESICKVIAHEVEASKRYIPLLLASSTQAVQANPYGRSKLAAEQSLQTLANVTSNPCVVFRLPGVFGKWCKPNYNSVVATFCHNIARGLPININEPTTALQLVYIDDVVDGILKWLMQVPALGFVHSTIRPEYTVSLNELVTQIRAFGDGRTSLMLERVGVGFVRALYATYVSYLPYEKFSYELQMHEDARGVFVEMIKTPDCGQLSYFTAYPGVTRGGHYHHTKTEKFLVIKGSARFRFRNLLSNECIEFLTSGDRPRVVDTIPGWIHDITNVGNDEMVVMLWANEIFNRQKPDTIASKV